MLKVIVIFDKTEGRGFARGEAKSLRMELKRLIHDNPILLVWPNLKIAQVTEIPIAEGGIQITVEEGEGIESPDA